jgi:predicted transcriptional regulator
MNATVIQQERLEKLRGIAFGDVSDAIKSLQLVFEQRGEVARAILNGGEYD